MKTAYKRLNRDHRIEIEKQIALGKNNKQIASTLSVHPSTISRELKRVKNEPYDNLKAEVNYVHNLLENDWEHPKLTVIQNSKILYIHNWNYIGLQSKFQML